MKTFRINDRISIDCEWKKTRTAFKHTAVLRVAGRPVTETKICYDNRTWEPYEFRDVLRKVVNKTNALTPQEKAEAIGFIQDYKEEGTFSALLGIAAMGDILCNTQAEKNDWKKRMMKASLGEGVMFPDDWDQLPEDEKKRRLDGALEQLK